MKLSLCSISLAATCIALPSLALARTTPARCQELQQYVYSGTPSVSSPMWRCEVSNGAECGEILQSRFGREWVDGKCWNVVHPEFVASSRQTRCVELADYVYGYEPSHPGSEMWHCERGEQRYCDMIKTSPLGYDWVAAKCWQIVR